MQELDSWLEHLPAATIMQKNLATCTPADLLVYVESHWLLMLAPCYLMGA